MTNKKEKFTFILLQVIASFFIAESFSQLILLCDISFINTYYNHGHAIINPHEFTDQEILKNLERIFWARILGIISSFIVVLIFTNRKKGFRTNATLVFIIEICLLSFVKSRELVLSFIEPIFFKFGSIFKKFGFEYYFISNGLLLLAIGVYLLFYNIRNLQKS